jgi:hypothetical protein
MTEVVTPPPSHEMFVKSGMGDLEIAQFSEQQLKELPLSDIRGIINGSLARQLKMAMGDLEMETAIKGVASVAFGPLLHDVNKLDDDNKEVRDMEVSAKLGHRLAHSAFFAGRIESDPQFTESNYALISALEKLTSRSEPEMSKLKRFWNGVKGELAAIKILRDLGFRVYIPNYSAQSRETMLLDIQGGIDIMAISPRIPNTVLCMDIKSRSGLSNQNNPTPINEITESSDRFKGWDPYVRGLLRGRTNRTILETIVKIPSQEGAFMGLNSDIENHREALRNFGFIHPNYESAIIRQLNGTGRPQ